LIQKKFIPSTIPWTLNIVSHASVLCGAAAMGKKKPLREIKHLIEESLIKCCFIDDRFDPREINV